jgi:hypothetical protein
MQESVSRATDKREDWQEKVAIVPLSIDDNADIVKSHNSQRGWDGIAHFVASSEAGASGFASPAARAFGIGGVPTAFLIGRDGNVEWRGHPMDNSDGLNVESRINAALEKK